MFFCFSLVFRCRSGGFFLKRERENKVPYLLVMLTTVPVCAACASFLRKKFEEVMPLFLCGLIIFSYFCGLLGAISLLSGFLWLHICLRLSAVSRNQARKRVYSVDYDAGLFSVFAVDCSRLVDGAWTAVQPMGRVLTLGTCGKKYV